MNLPVAISKICSMRPEETLIGIENWVDVAEMEVVSKCVMVNHDGLEIVEIVTSENDYLIYCDIFPGFSTFPVSESSIMGEKLWNLVGRMPHSLDDPVYFAPKKTKLLLKNLKRKIYNPNTQFFYLGTGVPKREGSIKSFRGLIKDFC